MGTLDIIILICFIPAIVRGISKGFIEQAVALVSVILGAWMAYRFSSLACEWLKPYLEVSDTVLNVAAFAAIALAVVIILFIAGKMLTGIVKLVMLDWADRVLGFIFAILKAGLVIGLVIILFDTVNIRFELVDTAKLDASVLYNPIKDAAYVIFPYLKELLLKQ